VWTEVLTLYLGSCLLIRGIYELTSTGTLSKDWLVLVALIFLYTPWVAERWNHFRVDGEILFPDPFWPAMKKALMFSGAIIGVVYVFFLPGYHLCQTELYHWFSTAVLDLDRPYPQLRPVNGITGGIGVTILMQALYQLLCVGYAEEFFYRGYMQTRLDGLFKPDRFAFLGAKFGWSLPITAVLFTVGHSLVTLQWWQPFILFPALVFGWMRARTGNILAAAIFHAFANTAMIILDHIYGVSPDSVLQATGWSEIWGDLGSIGDWFRGLI